MLKTQICVTRPQCVKYLLSTELFPSSDSRCHLIDLVKSYTARNDGVSSEQILKLLQL